MGQIDGMKFLSSALQQEESRISASIGLIASESLTPPWVRSCLNSAFHMRTVEGIVGQRYFPACEFIDEVERNAELRFARMFGFQYANVQPHCATTANIAALLSLAKPGDSILSLATKSGGHVSHGVARSLTAKLFKVHHYTLDRSGILDYDEIERIANVVRPRVIISGASCYSDRINHAIFQQIANAVRAFHMVDIAHTAGLIAAGVLEEDIGEADVVTFSTQKTLLGPRGGVVLTNNSELKERINAAVFPGLQGALHNNNIAGKCACSVYAETAIFQSVMQKVLAIANALSQSLHDEGLQLIGGLPKNHQVILDLRPANVDTNSLVNALAALGIRTNANYLTGDDSFPSGVRIGSTVLAQLGYSTEQAKCIGKMVGRFCNDFINDSNIKPNAKEKHLLRELVFFNQEQYTRYVMPSDLNYDEYRSDYNDREFALSTVFQSSAKQGLPITAPKVSYFTQNSIKQLSRSDSLLSLRSPNTAIIIPARDCPDSLSIVLEYIRNILPNTKVICCLSGTTIQEMIDVTRRFKSIAIDPTHFLGWHVEYCGDWGIEKEQLLSSRGKGLDLLSGVYYCYANGVRHFYFMDADFINLSNYDPLRLLASAKHLFPEADHLLIATPNRKNDGLHALIDNMDILEIAGCEAMLNSVQMRLREIIHLLAGERYCSRRFLECLPFASGYGIETIMNLVAAKTEFQVGQVENAIRQDKKNSREKNECMLVNCTRFLLALLSFGKLPADFNENDILEFNIKYCRQNESTILPDRPGETVRRFFCRKDLVFPNLKTLSKRLSSKKRNSRDLIVS